MVASKSQVSLTHEETRQGIPEALCLYGISKATVFFSHVGGGGGGEHTKRLEWFNQYKTAT